MRMKICNEAVCETETENDVNTSMLLLCTMQFASPKLKFTT